MSVLRFASEDSLRFTITSGLVPEAVLAAGARVWRDAEGAVFVAPAVSVAPEAMKTLAAAGIGRLPAKTSSPEARSVGSWAEIVGVRRTSDVAEDVGQVLFVIEDGGSLTDLAGELLRLGCDRLEWRTSGERHLLRAAALLYLPLVGESWQLYLFAALFGATFFTTAPLSSTLVGQLFGPAHHGAIFGAANLFHHGAGALGSYIGGLVFDLAGSYRPVFLLAALVVVGSACVTPLARRAR